MKLKNKIWDYLKNIWIILTNKIIPGLKEWRDIENSKKLDKKLDVIDKKVTNEKEKDEAILLREILDKKIFDKRKLLETIQGDYYMLIVFAFPRLPKLWHNDKDKKTIENFLEKKLGEVKGNGKRNYTTFLTEELKFKKFGYSASTNFFIKSEDLRKDLQKITKLKVHLEENLLFEQRKEWDLVIKCLEKSKNQKIIEYVGKMKERGFDELYNISFYLDSVNFRKDSVFAQNENSFLITNFLKLENLVSNRKDLESLKENFKFLDISLFFTQSLKKEIKEILGSEENQNKIKKELKIEHFFEEINKEDLEKIFKDLLGNSYEKKYVNSFYKKQEEFRKLLKEKGIIV